MVTSSAFKYLIQTGDWQTQWTSQAVQERPNKVALRRRDNAELLGLMSYTLDEKGLAVEIIYLESAGHSNANLLRTNILGLPKRSLPMRRLCLLRLVLGVSCFSRQRPLNCGNTIYGSLVRCRWGLMIRSG